MAKKGSTLILTHAEDIGYHNENIFLNGNFNKECESAQSQMESAKNNKMTTREFEDIIDHIRTHYRESNDTEKNLIWKEASLLLASAAGCKIYNVC